MPRKNIVCILTSVVVMLVFPAMASICIQADCGLMAYFLMLFVINPITAIRIGIFTGENISAAWFQPFILTVSFALGGWLFSGMVATDLAFYVIIYLLLGYGSMFIALFGVRRRIFRL